MYILLECQKSIYQVSNILSGVNYLLYVHLSMSVEYAMTTSERIA